MSSSFYYNIAAISNLLAGIIFVVNPTPVRAFSIMYLSLAAFFFIFGNKPQANR